MNIFILFNYCLCNKKHLEKLDKIKNMINIIYKSCFKNNLAYNNNGRVHNLIFDKNLVTCTCGAKTQITDQIA